MFEEYRKKPIVVRAAKWTDPENAPEGIWDVRKQWRSCCPDEKSYFGKVTTLEGTVRIELNDYLVIGIEGELYPCNESIFEKTYEPA